MPGKISPWLSIQDESQNHQPCHMRSVVVRSLCLSGPGSHNVPPELVHSSFLLSIPHTQHSPDTPLYTLFPVWTALPSLLFQINFYSSFNSNVQEIFPGRFFKALVMVAVLHLFERMAFPNTEIIRSIMADVCLFLLTHCPAYEKMAKAVAQGREYLRGEKGYRI